MEPTGARFRNSELVTDRRRTRAMVLDPLGDPDCPTWMAPGEAPGAGLEPATLRLTAGCSAKLSYPGMRHIVARPAPSRFFSPVTVS